MRRDCITELSGLLLPVQRDCPNFLGLLDAGDAEGEGHAEGEAGVREAVRAVPSLLEELFQYYSTVPDRWQACLLHESRVCACKCGVRLACAQPLR